MTDVERVIDVVVSLARFGIRFEVSHRISAPAKGGCAERDLVTKRREVFCLTTKFFSHLVDTLTHSPFVFACRTQSTNRREPPRWERRLHRLFPLAEIQPGRI